MMQAERMAKFMYKRSPVVEPLLEYPDIPGGLHVWDM
jgi:hypothetical protein